MLKDQGTGRGSVKRSKTHGIPGLCDRKTERKDRRNDQEMRKSYGITAAYKMVDTCAAEFAATTPYYYSVYGGENEAERTPDKKKFWYLVPARSVSDRVSSSTSVLYTVPGPLQKKAMRPSSSTTTRRP